MDDEVDAA
jgi:hypothetical protein